MQPDEKNAALLWDMLSHAREVSGFVAGKTYDEYRANRLLRLAVERLVHIIGEAAYCVSRPYRDANPQIPWVPIMKQRHILVHDYGVIDDEKIWRVATVHGSTDSFDRSAAPATTSGSVSRGEPKVMKAPISAKRLGRKQVGTMRARFGT